MNVIKKRRGTSKVFAGLLIILGVLIISSVILAIFVCRHVASPVSKPKAQTTSTTAQTTNSSKKDATNQPVAQSAFNSSQYSTTDPASLWIVVNKKHPLSTIDYAPSDLVTVSGATISTKAQADFSNMISSAKAQSVNLTTGSSYRSYSTQTSLYNSYVAANGQTAADTFSAKPGYSEHQTGLAIDFTSNSNPNCNYDDCFATTSEGAWLSAHATEYGFLLRYTTDKQSVTGFKNEPWHYRYIGKELAAEMKKRGIYTLEEFFNIAGGTFY